MDSWDWVRWCHKRDPEAVRQATVDVLMDQFQRSKLPNPLVVSQKFTDEGLAAGYLIMYPGALGVVGNLRIEMVNNHSVSPQSQRALLNSVTDELCESAFRMGAEIVQAVVPIHSLDQNSDSQAFANGGGFTGSMLKPVARLLQMSSNDVLRVPIYLSQSRQLEMVPHHALPRGEWCELINDTYVDTLDVPELNGARSIENTLEGYTANLIGPPKTWWALRENGANVGCLLLSPIDSQCAELTYLGVIPRRREQGIGRAAMHFISTWMVEQQVRRLVLAVDDRNHHAIRLYESCGMNRDQSLMVWIAISKQAASAPSMPVPPVSAPQLNQ